MSLPDGVTTCTLTYDGNIDTFGGVADSITVEVKADRVLVHAASGKTLFNRPFTATAPTGGIVSLSVPHTDQTGFRDVQGNSFTGWSYTATITARFGNEAFVQTKTFQVPTGQTTVDLDLLPSPGMVQPGTTAPTATVTSVQGMTGAVDLTGTFVPRPTGGNDGQVLKKSGSSVVWSDDLLGSGGGGGGAAAFTGVDSPDVGTTGTKLHKVGPVIQPGVAGAFDALVVESLTVHYCSENGRFAGTYVGYGYDADGTTVRGSIGLAWSDDGITWEKAGKLFGANPTAGQPDSGGTTGPLLVFEDGLWHLFYIALTTSGYEGGTKTLAVATSPSLVNPTWTRRGVVLSPSGGGAFWRRQAIWHPNIVRHNGKWYCFINASGGDARERIGYASADALLGPWTFDDTVNTTATAGVIIDTYEPLGIAGDPSLSRMVDGWRMDFYRAEPGVISRDYFATCTDANFPAGPWVLGNNGKPILAPSQDYDAQHAAKPFITKIGGRTFHYYTGQERNVGQTEGRRTICLAVDRPLVAKPDLTTAPAVSGTTVDARLKSLIDSLSSVTGGGLRADVANVGAATVADNFTRADSSSLGSSSTGNQPWTHGAPWTLAGNKAVFAGNSNTQPATVTTGQLDNYEIKVTATFPQESLYPYGIILWAFDNIQYNNLVFKKTAGYVETSDGSTVTLLPGARALVSGETVTVQVRGANILVKFGTDEIAKLVSPTPVNNFLRTAGKQGFAGSGGIGAGGNYAAQVSAFSVAPITGPGPVTPLGALAYKEKVSAPGDFAAGGTPSATTFLRGDNTWATPPSGGGGSGSPLVTARVLPPRTGQFLANVSGSGTALTVSNGNLVAVPVSVPASISVDQFIIENVSTAGSSGALVRAGIYADDTSGYPGSLLVDLGTQAADTTGRKTFTPGSAVALPAGLYWLVYATQGAPSTVPQVASQNSFVNTGVLLGQINQFGGWQFGWLTTEGTYTGALPSTFPTTPGSAASTASSAPYFRLRRSA